MSTFLEVLGSVAEFAVEMAVDFVIGDRKPKEANPAPLDDPMYKKNLEALIDKNKSLERER